MFMGTSADGTPAGPPFAITPDSIRIAMDQAWRDHHHARDQTWKALQTEAALAAGIVGVHVQIKPPEATVGAAVLTLVAVVFGVGISLHHRRLEVRKFEHILHCEEALGLHGPGLISGVKLPTPIHLHDALRLTETNTALFILRMHLTIAAFAVLFALYAAPGPASRALLAGTLTITAEAMLVSLVASLRGAPAEEPSPAGGTTMSTEDNRHAYEVEYVQLRGEILKRIELRQQMVAITLTLAGVFLSVGVAGLGIPGRGMVVLVYPPLAALMALGWAQNDYRIRHVARYIREVSEPGMGGPRSGPGYETRTQESREKSRGYLGSWRFVVLSHGGMFLATQLMAIAAGRDSFDGTAAGGVLIGIEAAAVALVVWVIYAGMERTSREAPGAPVSPAGAPPDAATA